MGGVGKNLKSHSPITERSSASNQLGWAGWGQPWNARLRSSGFLWGRRFPFGLAPCESRRSFGLHLISSAHSLVQPSFILCATFV
ncbi:unnamed protein product [Prunus armeniaca]